MGRAKRRKRRGYCECWWCDPTARKMKYEAELDRLALEEAFEEASHGDEAHVVERQPSKLD